MLPLGVTTGFLHLIRFRPIDTALRREEQQPVVCGRDEEVLHHVIRSQLSALDALTSAVLAAVVVTAGAFDVPPAGNGEHHFFFWDEVFDVHVAVIAVHDLGAPVITELVDDLGEFLAHDVALALRAREDLCVVSDQALQLRSLVEDLLPLEGSESTQLHGEDRIGLKLVDVEQIHQTGASVVDGR